MTMEFGKAKPSDFAGIQSGQHATFSFHETQDGYVLDEVQAAGAKP
jgi:hypothetical protein